MLLRLWPAVPLCRSEGGMPCQGQGSCCPAWQLLSYLAVGDALLAPAAVCLQLLHL